MNLAKNAKFILFTLIAHFICVLAGVSPARALAENEKLWLAKHGGEIILCFDPHSPPVEFSSKDGLYDGMAADIFALVEKRLGFSFRKRPCNWSDILRQLEQGAPIVAAAIAHSTSRSEGIFFTAPYVEIPMALVARKGLGEDKTLSDFVRKKVAVVKDFAAVGLLRAKDEGLFEVVEVNDVRSGLQNVAFGAVDAMVVNLAAASYFIEHEALTNLHVAGNMGVSLPLSIGVSKENPVLFAILSKTLAGISQKEIETVAAKWLALKYLSPAVENTLHGMKLALLAGIIGIGIVFLNGLWLRKKLKERTGQLTETEQKVDNLVTNAPLGIFSSTPESRFLYLNQKMADIFGYASPAAMKEQVRDIRADIYVNPAARQQLVEELMQRGSIADSEQEVKHADGGKGWISLSMRKTQDGNGAVIFEGFCQDITDKKKVQLSLKESQSRLTMALQTSDAGAWNFYPGVGKVYFSSTWCMMLGYRPDELENSFDTWLSLLHPDDMLQTNSEVDRFLANGGHNTLELEFRMQTKEGLWRWFLIKGETIEWDFDGQPQRVTGVQFDIQRFKDTEEALKTSELLFRAIFNQTHQLSALIDKDGRFTQVNQTALDFFGVTEEDIVGRSFLANRWWLDNGKNRENLKVFMARTWRGETVRSEVMALGGEGNAHPVDFCLTPFRNKDGEVVSLIFEGRDVFEIKKVQNRLEYEIHHDSLTRLGNRRQCIKAIYEMQLKEHGGGMSILYFDICHFENINHAYGHRRGDELLIIVAERLAGIAEYEMTAHRVGGDQFAVLFRTERPKDAMVFARRIRDEVCRPYCLDGEDVAVDFAFGLAFCGAPEKCVDKVFSQAAIAHMRAKKTKNNPIIMYNRQIHQQFLRNLYLSKAIGQGLLSAEFYLEYQPIIDSRTRCLYGMEALLRWNSAIHGSISPNEFIPIAEENNQINLLGEFVLEQACNFWQQAGFARETLILCVNVSGRQFAQQGFFKRLQSILDRTGMSPSSLKLEITETALMENAHETVIKLKILRKLGVKISIDDFGTGYSSLDYLRQFSADTLKIDMSFIQKMEKDRKSYELVRAMINLAKTFEMTVIAEGIETLEQSRLLQQLGCFLHQGFYYSRPLSQAHEPVFYR